MNIFTSTVSRALQDRPSIGVQTKTKEKSWPKSLLWTESNRHFLSVAQDFHHWRHPPLNCLKLSFRRWSAASRTRQRSIITMSWLLNHTTTNNGKGKFCWRWKTTQWMDGSFQLWKIPSTTTISCCWRRTKSLLFFRPHPNLPNIPSVGSDSEHGTMQAVFYI